MKRALLWGIRLFLAGLFLHSGWIKLLDPAGFAQSVANYRMLPAALVTPMAVFLPWLEIWSALALLIHPLLRRAGRGWIFFMLVVFTLAKITALARGLDISCGCGTSEDPMTIRDVAENLFLLALCAADAKFTAAPGAASGAVE